MAICDPAEVRECMGGLPERARVCMSHVLTCRRCQEVAAPMLRGEADLALEPRPAVSALDYSTLFPRLEARLRRAMPVVEAEKRDAKALVAELLSRPVHERRDLVAARKVFRSLAVADLLLDRSAETAGRLPFKAEELAATALTVAESLEPARYTVELIGRVRARAWALIGHARGARGEPDEAEAAFERAGRLLLDDLESLEAAAFCRLLATLRREQGKVHEALALAQRAAAICARAGDLEGEEAVLREMGRLYREQGQEGLLVESSHAASRLALANARFARLAVRCRHTLAQLAENGRAVDDDAPGEHADLELEVLGAQVAASHGDLAAAERGFAAVLDQAAGRGAGFEGTLAFLNLAGLLVRQDRLDELARYAERAVGLLGGATPEPLRTLCAAALAGRATRALVLEATKALRLTLEADLEIGLTLFFAACRGETGLDPEP